MSPKGPGWGPATGGRSRQPEHPLAPGFCGSGDLAFSTLKAEPLPSPKADAPPRPITDIREGQRFSKKWERAGQPRLCLGTHLWAVGCWGPRGSEQWMRKGQEWWGPPTWPQWPQGVWGQGLSGTG